MSELLAEQGGISKEELSMMARENARIYFRTRFDFLHEHYGPRPGAWHTILGTPGSGKSSIVQAIAADLSVTSPILIILSEESRAQYEYGISLASHDEVPYKPENLYFLEIATIPEESKASTKKLSDYIEDAITECGARAVIFDNATTSPFYTSGSGLKVQEWFINRFIEMFAKLQIAGFMVYHTSKNIDDNMGRLLTIDDIRGSNMGSMMPHYFYIFQNFTADEKKYPFIFIRKHRFHRHMKNKIFHLVWKNGKYVGDVAVDFSDVNKAFLKRNKLSQKK